MQGSPKCLQQKGVYRKSLQVITEWHNRWRWNDTESPNKLWQTFSILWHASKSLLSTWTSQTFFSIYTFYDTLSFILGHKFNYQVILAWCHGLLLSGLANVTTCHLSTIFTRLLRRCWTLAYLVLLYHTFFSVLHQHSILSFYSPQLWLFQHSSLWTRCLLCKLTNRLIHNLP